MDSGLRRGSEDRGRTRVETISSVLSMQAREKSRPYLDMSISRSVWSSFSSVLRIDAGEQRGWGLKRTCYIPRSSVNDPSNRLGYTRINLSVYAEAFSFQPVPAHQKDAPDRLQQPEPRQQEFAIKLQDLQQLHHRILPHHSLNLDPRRLDPPLFEQAGNLPPRDFGQLRLLRAQEPESLDREPGAALISLRWV